MPHTPGPWKRRYYDRVTTMDDTDGSKSIAHVYESNGCQEANANLIAAAPMLLDVCKAMLTHLEANAAHQPADNFHRKLYAAIAAAEGGEDNEL